jgi:hypothetical protein
VKRDPALAALSRDHHQALVVARTLTRATASTAGETRSRFLDFWEHHGRVHFRVEEEVLLPAYARHGSAHHPAVAHVLCDHVAIRALADQVAADPNVALDVLAELGVELALHVRFEERELFWLIEQAMSAPALAALADAIEDAEQKATAGG